MMDFKEGEVLYFNKPLGWTSFKVVGHARYHICRGIREMDEHTCYILSLRSTFLQTVNMTSKNILLEYSIKRLMIAF